MNQASRGRSEPDLKKLVAAAGRAGSGSSAGHVYVLEVRGPVSYVKVGATAAPLDRLRALRGEGWRIGCTLTQAWLSPPHEGYVGVESRLLAACRHLAPPRNPRSEYFPDLLFEDAKRLAHQEVERIRSAQAAAEKQHRAVSPVRADVHALPLAAGTYEPIPDAVRKLIPQRPLRAVRPGDETCYEWLVEAVEGGLKSRHVPVPRLGAVPAPRDSAESSSAADRDLFGHYLAHANEEPLRQTFREIARHLRMSPQAVSKSVTRLRDRGLLVEAERHGKVAFYSVSPAAVGTSEAAFRDVAAWINHLLPRQPAG